MSKIYFDCKSEATFDELQNLFAEIATIESVEFIELDPFSSEYLNQVPNESESESPIDKPNRFGFIKVTSKADVIAAINTIKEKDIHGLLLFGPHGSGEEP